VIVRIIRSRGVIVKIIRSRGVIVKIIKTRIIYILENIYDHKVRIEMKNNNKK